MELQQSRRRWYKTGDLGAPGARHIDPDDLRVYVGIIREMVKRYDVDKEEILVGFGDIPPSDPTCLVYVRLTNCFAIEFFRKGMKPDGRWVCWNYLREEIAKEPSLKGTYNLREGIQYRT